MVTARALSLLELKKKQWAKEREELAGLQGIWATLRKDQFHLLSKRDEDSPVERSVRTAGASPYSSTNLPPIISNHHYDPESGEERGGDTSGYASDAGYEVTSALTSSQYIKPEPYITRLPYRCSTESGEWSSPAGWRSGGEERARWGERGLGVGRLWTPPVDSPSSPDTPAWTNRAIRDGGAEVLVISHEDGSGTMSSDRSSEARLDTADTDNTRNICSSVVSQADPYEISPYCSMDSTTPEYSDPNMLEDDPKRGRNIAKVSFISFETQPQIRILIKGTNHTTYRYIMSERYGRTHVRGQNAPLPQDELDDRLRKRQKALQHQQAIKQQLEEKERLKREEREREMMEEAKAEERLRRQQLVERQRYLLEQQKLREKQEKEERKAKAMKEALEEAERKAKEEKIKMRMRHVSKESGCTKTRRPSPPVAEMRRHSNDICEQEPRFKQETRDSCEVPLQDCHRTSDRCRPDSLSSKETVFTSRKFAECERPTELPCIKDEINERVTSYFDSIKQEDLRSEIRSEQTCCSNSNDLAFINISRENINEDHEIVKDGRQDVCSRVGEKRDNVTRNDSKDGQQFQNVISHRSYQSFSVVAAAPRIDSTSPLRPLTPQDNQDVREMLAARKDSVGSRRDPLEESVIRALEALKTHDPVVEIESSQLRLVATPEQGRLLTPSKYRPTRWTEKATQTEAKRLTRSLRGVQRLEERPKWGVNRPERKFVKASDRDPYRRRNVRLRRTNSNDDQDTSRSSSPGQEPSYQPGIKSSLHYPIRTGLSKARKTGLSSKAVCTPRVMRLNVRRDSQTGLVRTSSAVRRLLAISAFQSQEKSVAVSSEEHHQQVSSNLLSVQDLLSQISALKQGLYMKQKEWEISRSQTPYSEGSSA